MFFIKNTLWLLMIQIYAFNEMLLVVTNVIELWNIGIFKRSHNNFLFPQFDDDFMFPFDIIGKFYHVF